MGHYYDPNGAMPRHHVRTRNGALRPTWVSDARKHGWVPSVTTVEPYSRQLADWRARQIYATTKALAFQGEITAYNDDDADWELVQSVTEARLDKAPSIGTDIHADMEAAANGAAIDALFYAVQIRTLDNLLLETFDLGLSVFTPEVRFVHPWGYGGCVDLHSRDHNLIIDLKTTEGLRVIDGKPYKKGNLQRKMVWPNHQRQGAAYRHGLGMDGARFYNAFISTDSKDGWLEETSEADLVWALQSFRNKLVDWHHDHNWGSVDGIQHTISDEGGVLTGGDVRQEEAE